MLQTDKFLRAALCVFLGVIAVSGAASANGVLPLQQLGELLYFDTNLSTPPGQSCASCHDPANGFVDPDSELPVSQGVLPRNRFGSRNSPAAGYAMYAPMFHFDAGEGLWIGGQFWDGRATGEVLGDPLADQALGPFLGALEMNNPSKHSVINKIRRSDYADLFEAVWGSNVLRDTETAYDAVQLSIAAFERSGEFAKFNSRYDEYLEACLFFGGEMNDCAQGLGVEAETARLGVLDEEEWMGLRLFVDENDNDGVLEAGEGAGCAACHVAEWTFGTGHVPAWAPGAWVPPVFTDFSFDNLGVPANPANPFYDLPPRFNRDGSEWIDLGLGGFLQSAGYDTTVYMPEMGKVKVMSLRNIGLTAPYMHNGVFDDLLTVTHFYNTRDLASEMWPAAEVVMNVNDGELGDLGLDSSQEAAIVAFMMTLSDR
jgi:cytochrome c peroxidase